LVLVLAVAVAVEMVVAMIAVVVISLARPEVDLSDTMSALGNQITVVVVGVLGYLAGNTRLRLEQKKDEPPPTEATPNEPPPWTPPH
jgi:hypothetical protein